MNFMKTLQKKMQAFLIIIINYEIFAIYANFKN